jgi:hypothetical protein
MAYKDATPATNHPPGSLPVIHLEAGQLLDLTDAAGVAVKATSGRLWITQDRDSRDIVLNPNQSFVIDRPGLTLISAIGSAALVLQLPNGLAPFHSRTVPLGAKSIVDKSQRIPEARLANERRHVG